ncbi:hypothetical protein IMCC26134_05300 [Verrucomicrobia bacterium IMCC26134]|nr:hypothetical protein IMCC26134_05300 [Verrucomicrobia bacterium IMCC26134]
MGPPFNSIQYFTRSVLVSRSASELSGAALFHAGPVLAFAPDEAGFRVPRARQLIEAHLGPDVTSSDSWRSQVPLPEGRFFVRPLLPLDGASFRCDLPPYVAALLLGLCGEGYYAPDRPLILSEARLGRHLQLHSLGSYYA